MSTAVLVQPVGVGYPVSRASVFDTTKQIAISGKETRIARQTSPRYTWSFDINVLRSSPAYSATEFAYILGFFNARLGSFDTFLYQDADDNQVIGQQIGIGDGATTTFQFVRSLGGFVEPILAPNYTAGVEVFLNGVLQTSGISFSAWGSANPGQVVFATAPASGVVITANINYYWPCRMVDDTLTLSLMMNSFYEAKKFAFMSVKN